jgi:hypothetical protein
MTFKAYLDNIEAKTGTSAAENKFWGLRRRQEASDRREVNGRFREQRPALAGQRTKPLAR